MEYRALRSDISRNGPKFYYAGEPGAKLDRLAKMLFEMDENSVLWYGKPEGDYVLGRMDGVFLPVTRALLTKDGPVMAEYVPFALKNGIPVVPILQEPGLEKLYARVFGDLQYLSDVDDDLTALSLSEKIRRNFMRLSGENPFNGSVFVSYRKKDRAHILPLQKAVHDVPIFRDFPLWYDEYLTPGENFNDSIRTALEAADLCILLVTPHLLEPGNFVLTEEYPMIRRLRKPVLAVEAVPTDRAALKEAYPGLPEVVPLTDGAGVGAALYSVAGALDFSSFPTHAEHEYRMGMAYFTGYRVERDLPRALRILSGAARRGHYPAAAALCDFYRDGTVPESTPGEGLAWAKSVLDLARKQGRPGDLSESLLRCAEWSAEAGKYAEAIGYYREYADGRKDFGEKYTKEDADLCLRIARCALLGGDSAGAGDLIGYGRSLVKSTGKEYTECDYLLSAAETLVDTGFAEAALPYLEDAGAYLRDKPLRHEIFNRLYARKLAGDGRVALHRGEEERGRRLLDEAFVRRKDLWDEFAYKDDKDALSGLCDDLFPLYAEQGRGFVEAGDLGAAAKAFDRAFRIVSHCARMERRSERLADMIRCNLLRAAVAKKEVAREMLTRSLRAAEQLAATEPGENAYGDLLALVKASLRDLEG